MNDPIVDEVRRIRDAHAARFNYDLDAIYQDIKEQERKSNRTFVAPPTRLPGSPSSAIVDKEEKTVQHKQGSTMKFRIYLEQDEDSQFIATCPALPGCISQGKTREEARANIADAIAGYLESLRKHNEPIPPAITEELIEVDL
jgi:predicted RNase H-like HicB family nuclease